MGERTRLATAGTRTVARAATASVTAAANTHELTAHETDCTVGIRATAPEQPDSRRHAGIPSRQACDADGREARAGARRHGALARRPPTDVDAEHSVANDAGPATACRQTRERSSRPEAPTGPGR
jgi:hypothetical protein